MDLSIGEDKIGPNNIHLKDVKNNNLLKIKYQKIL